jgi:rhodanese-related sulfurtransferase
MAPEYVDDEELENEIRDASGKDIVEADPSRYVTNTKIYNSMKFEIISPEEVERAHQINAMNNPNQEFKDAVTLIEKNNNKTLTKEEYIKAADSYATILAERDEERKKNYEGKYVINPIKKEKYFQMLLENKPVENAIRELVRDYENSLVNPLEKALEEAQKNEANVLEVKKNRAINFHYKGKCRIASDEGGKVIVIDNKNDVDLLRMKYRKEWIEKRFPEEVNKQTPLSVEDGDFE